jgi:multidrug resistance efflux pump
MQMIVGLVVLVLIAVGVWWYMGNGTPVADDAVMQDDSAMVEDTAVVDDSAMEEVQ